MVCESDPYAPLPRAEVDHDEALVLISVDVVEHVECRRPELVTAQIGGRIPSGHVEPCLINTHTHTYTNTHTHIHTHTRTHTHIHGYIR